MRFLKGFLPNLTIALNLALLVVLYLDRRNPMMGFFIGEPFLVLAIVSCVCSLVTAVMLYKDWRKTPKSFREAKVEKIENDT